MFPGSITVAMLMITLALGYGVCFLAGREKKVLKNIGNIVGAIIILLSLILIGRTIIYSTKHCCGKKMGSMKKCPQMTEQHEQSPMAPQVTPSGK